MIKTTFGNLWVNSVLPKDLRDYNRRLDKKNAGALFQEIAAKYPEQYRDISKKLSDIGHKSATESGSYSFGLESLVLPPKTAAIKQALQGLVDNIFNDPKLNEKQKSEKLISTLQSKTQELESTLYDEAVAAKNPLAMQILSGARGNPGNLRSILGGDLLYEDHRGRLLPLPVLKSYSEGLSPAEYWAGTFGARKGVIDVQQATQDAGYFGKQLNQATHRLVVTSRDADKYDGLLRGVPMNTDDPDNEGSMLAHDIGGFKRNTQLTPKVMSELKSKGIDKILVRSPMVGGNPEGGLYAYDVGVRERGGLPPTGDNVGVAAAQALGEQATQSSLASKHSGGVAGAGTAISGFKYINQLAQVPKTFTGGATHAEVDGKVGAIYDAPAGGKYMMINGTRHFVHQGHEPRVKPGDIVEAGDIVSDGLPNPAKIVEHKGIGEGRRYFMDTMRKLYKDSGLKAHRRNIELLSRGIVNHVELNDELGDFVPGDVIPYDIIESQYQPRPDHSVVPISRATNKYLEGPILHYSIGTKIKPSMIKQMSDFGIKNVLVHNDPPPFSAKMLPIRYNLLNDPDWMTRQLGIDLRKGLLQGAHRGISSDELGTSYVPSLAHGVDFGRVGKTKAWNPKDVIKTEIIKPEQEMYETKV